MASLSINPPQNLPKKGKLSDNWRQWKQNFEIYLGAAGINSNDEKACPLFLHCIGQHGRDIFNDLGISEPYTLKQFYAKFDEFCNTKRNLIFERYTFFNTRQENQSFDKFYSLLKQRSLDCELGDITDSLIATQIVIGINDASLRKHLLTIPDLTLKDIVETCKSTEAAKLQLQRMEALTSSKNKKESTPTHKLESNAQINDKKNKSTKADKMEVKQKPAVITNCTFCSGTHKNGECPKDNALPCKSCGKSHKKGKCPAHGAC